MTPLFSKRTWSAVGANFGELKRSHGVVQVGMNLQERIDVGKIQQLAHERTRTGNLQIRLLRLRPGVQKNQFADTRAIDRRDTAEIKNYLSAMVEYFTDHMRKACGLFAIDNAALAMNDHDIAAISGFETQFQGRLLRLCCRGSQLMRLRK